MPIQLQEPQKGGAVPRGCRPKYECDSASMSSDTLRQQVKRGGVAVRLPRLRTHRCAAVSRLRKTTGRLTFLCVPLWSSPPPYGAQIRTAELRL